MKKLLVSLALLLAAGAAAAQPRPYSQPELDSLLAPIALHPDALLNNILAASAFPQQVQDAAQWSRANPQLSGDAAVQAATPYNWQPPVTALVAYPDVLARMVESPQWLRDLGEAWRLQEPHVLDTVQGLRRRAEASGNLKSDEYQNVYRQDDVIVVQPAYREVVYVRYYDPLVVYGPWWWPAYRPVFWRPWIVRPVHTVWVRYDPRPRYYPRPVHQHKPVHVHKPAQAQPHARPFNQARPQPQQRTWNGTPSPAARLQAENTARFVQQHRPQVAAPQVRQMPAPAAYSQQRPAPQVSSPPRAAPRFQAQQERRGGHAGRGVRG